MILSVEEEAAKIYPGKVLLSELDVPQLCESCMQGNLEILSGSTRWMWRRGSSWKKRFFEVDMDFKCINIYKRKPKKKERPLLMVPIVALQYVRKFDLYSFEVYDGNNLYILRAQSPMERMLWIDHLSHLIEVKGLENQWDYVFQAVKRNRLK